MADNHSSDPGSAKNDKKAAEDELRRLYPDYDAKLKYMENRPFIFRYGPLRVLYTAITDLFKSWAGQVRDPSSPTAWRAPSASEQRQIHRQGQKRQRDKRK